MRYTVKLTAQAVGQIEETVQYISKVLLAPETARKWADALQSEMKKLDAMPSRYPLTEEEPWRARGIHRMPVKHFLVYFLVDEEEQVVWVTAVIYGRKDQVTALFDMPLNDAEP